MEIEEAVSALINKLASVDECESVSLVNATGRILGEDINAGIPVPSFPKSAMDGYAVRSSDIEGASADSPVQLEVIGRLFAGDAIPSSLRGADVPARGAVRIMTGAIVPEAFDTVIRQEDTDCGEDTVSIYKSQKPFVNYCKAGEDIAQGSRIASRGTLIGRAEAGVIASVGAAFVNVLRKLRVAVISTGSEIVDIGTPLAEAQIYNNVAYMLKASLGSSAFEVELSSVPDDIDAIVEALNKARDYADIIITTGGVSVGQKDLLPEALDIIGAQKVFAGVNIKPGSPTTGAVIDGKALLCLSGNPYAAVANFDLYIGSIISEITGCSAYIPVRSKAVLMSEFDKPSNVRRLVRARALNGEVTILSKNQASSVLSSFVGANCYIDFPKGSSVNKGDKVNIINIPEALR